MKINEAIRKPVISEKSLLLATAGEYTFEVDGAVTKNSLRKAFKEAFGVDVVRVRTLITKGRTRRVWGKQKRATVTPIKKAQIRLQKGQKIDVFEVKGN